MVRCGLQTYCRVKAVRRLQVDSPRLRHTSTLGKYIDHSDSRTDDSYTLYVSNSTRQPVLFMTGTVRYILHIAYLLGSGLAQNYVAVSLSFL